MRRFFVVSHSLIALIIAIPRLNAAVPESSSYLNSFIAEALGFLQSQDEEKAFSSFLNALDQAELKPEKSPLSQEEQQTFKEALQFYLKGNHDPQQTALEILKKYSSPAENQTQPFSLKPLPLHFLVALAYANGRCFKQFFTLFYPTYCAYPDHYLSYKTKAILSIKLFEKSRNVADREKKQEAIRQNIQLAIEQNSKERGFADISLYKLGLLFAEEKNKEAQLEAFLNKILDDTMIIERSDIPFFAEQILDTKRVDLAKRFLDKARLWYPYSRSLDSIQQQLLHLEKNDTCQ